MTQMNYWLGDNELVIVHHTAGWECDVWKVIEFAEDWQAVYYGTREQCVAYCTKRFKEYLESILG